MKKVSFIYLCLFCCAFCGRLALTEPVPMEATHCFEFYAMAGMDSEGRLLPGDESLPDRLRSETLEIGLPPSPHDFTSTFAIVGGKVIEPKTPALTPLPPERKTALLELALKASHRSSQKDLSELLTNPRTQQTTVHILEARETLLALQKTKFFEDFARNLRAFQYWYPEKEERDAAWKKWFHEQENHYQVSFSPKALEALSQLRDTYPTVLDHTPLDFGVIRKRFEDYKTPWKLNEWLKVHESYAVHTSPPSPRSVLGVVKIAKIYTVPEVRELMRGKNLETDPTFLKWTGTWSNFLAGYINAFVSTYNETVRVPGNQHLAIPDVFEIALESFLKEKDQRLSRLLTPLLRAVICPEAPALFTKEEILQRLRANTAKELETQIAVLNSHQAEEHKEALATFVTVIGATSQDSKTPQEDAPRNITGATAPAVNTQAPAKTHSRPPVTHRRQKKRKKQKLPNTPSAPSQEALPPFDPNSLSEQESKALLEASFFREADRETFMEIWSSLQAKVQPDLADRLKINILQLTHKLRHNAPVRDLKLNRVGKNLFEFYPLGSAQNPRLFIAKIHNHFYLYALELNIKQGSGYQNKIIQQFTREIDTLNKAHGR